MSQSRIPTVAFHDGATVAIHDGAHENRAVVIIRAKDSPYRPIIFYFQMKNQLFLVCLVLFH